MSQVEYMKRVLALRVNLLPLIFPQKSIATEIIKNAEKKSIFKANAAMYVC